MIGRNPCSRALGWTSSVKALRHGTANVPLGLNNENHQHTRPHRPAIRSVYCRVIARFNRCSGVMKWSWESVPRSICTQYTFPLNALVWRV